MVGEVRTAVEEGGELWYGKWLNEHDGLDLHRE